MLTKIIRKADFLGKLSILCPVFIESKIIMLRRWGLLFWINIINVKTENFLKKNFNTVLPIKSSFSFVVYGFSSFVDFAKTNLIYKKYKKLRGEYENFILCF